MNQSTMTDGESLFFSDRVLDAIASFRDTDHMVDVHLCAGMKVFPCHRLILAATSPYFDAMFNSGLRESKEYQIFITDVSEETMETLIDYFYTGAINITYNNAVDILRASDLFQIDTLKSLSIDFLTNNLSAENCLTLWRLAKQLCCLNMEYKSIKAVVDKFTDVVEIDDFLELTSEELCYILTDDRLNVISEEQVCNAACDWLNHEYDNRISDFATVIKHLRLPLVSIDYLINCFQPNIGNLNNLSSSILDEAKIFHLFPARQTMNDTPRTKSRMHFDYRDAVILIGSKHLPNNAVGVELKCIDMTTMQMSDMETPPTLHTIDFAVCTFGSDIYISGGSKSPTDLVHFHSLDQKWKSRCSMNFGRARHAMAAVGKYMYAFGGYFSGTVLNSIEQYSITFDSWSEIGNLNQAVCLTVAEAVGQIVYILGGLISEQTTTSIIQSFDARTKQVTTLTNQLPIRCALHRSTIQRDTIFIVNRTGKIIRYSASSPTAILSQLDSFNRSNFGVMFYHCEIHMFENDNKDPHSLILHRYDVENNSWKKQTVSSSEQLPVVSFCVRTLIKHDTSNTCIKL